MIRQQGITLLLLLVTLFCFSQEKLNTNKIDLDLLYEKEWLFDINTVNYLAEKTYILLSKQQDMPPKNVAIDGLSDLLMGAKINYENEKVTYYLPGDQAVKKTWSYEPKTKSIVTFEADGSSKTSKIIELTATKFTTLIEGNVKITLITAPSKVDETIFGEIKDYATFQGNSSSNIVIVNTQGGPVTKLEDDQLFGIMRKTSTKNLLYVNVHQAQTKSPGLFTEEDITFEEAKEYDNQSVENLYKVISYFKNKQKKVYVLGISFGAFMTQELIAKHGIDTADGYTIVVGRLDIDDKFWQGFSEGKNGEFKYRSRGRIKIKLSRESEELDRNMNRLAAGLGFNRYTEVLGNIPDLSKVNYIYGDRDKMVGCLSAHEIAFLKKKKANIVLVPGGDHYSAISEGVKAFKKSLGL